MEFALESYSVHLANVGAIKETNEAVKQLEAFPVHLSTRPSASKPVSINKKQRFHVQTVNILYVTYDFGNFS